MEFPILICMSIIVGLIVGFLSGLLGIGGGTLLVPVFKLGFGMSPLGSTATSLFTVIPTSITGAITHIRKRTCIPALGLAAGLGGAATSWIGVWLATKSPDWATMVAAALVIAYSAYTMLHKAIKLQKARNAERASGTSVSETSSTSDVSSEVDSNGQESLDTPDPRLEFSGTLTPRGFARANKKQVIICACIGLIAGVMSGYVGVGGGFIMVPLMMQIVGTPMKLTSGTSLIAVMLLAIPGTIAQAIFGNVNWIAGCFVALGAIPGAAIGSALIHKVPELTLRYMFSAFLFVAAAMLVINQLGIF